MSLSMYQATVPVFTRDLQNLSAILKKAEAHAEAKKIDPTVFINARIAPDMFPLSRQIQITTDVIKGGTARLAAIPIPSYEDTEKTFPELQERIAKTIRFMESVTAAQIDGSETRTVELKVGGRELQFTGQDYLLTFVLPNIYFHTTIAYAILRHNGVDIGKKDYLGG